jgi:hypothetical protein
MAAPADAGPAAPVGGRRDLDQRCVDGRVDTSGAAVVLHWDGSGWQTRLRLPDAELLDVAALSPSDVWAVGDEGQSPPQSRFLEVHWDGRRWSSYSQPSPNGGYGADPGPELVGLAAPAANDVWAAGDAENSGGPAWPDTVLFHWTGTSWRKALTPPLVWVSAVAARAPSELWIAGVTGNGDAYGRPKLERRIGINWQPTWLDRGQQIEGLAADQAQGLWAVGFVGSWFNGLGFPTQTLPLIKRARCS